MTVGEARERFKVGSLARTGYFTSAANYTRHRTVQRALPLDSLATMPHCLLVLGLSATGLGHQFGLQRRTTTAALPRAHH